MKPLCFDLYCGLGGWAEGFLAEGFDVIGFDIERHRYPAVSPLKDEESALKQEGAALKLGEGRPRGAGFNVANEKAYSDALKRGFTEWDEYPGQLVLQDALTIHGSQFKDAACIVCSPPCQEFSYMSMPWKRAKQIAAALRGRGEFPEGYRGSRTIAELTALFDACFRIQREACEAARHYIPMVVENVRGAQPWVGRAPWNYGSFYLWGDVPALMPFTRGRIVGDGTKQHGSGADWFDTGIAALSSGSRAGRKVPGLNFHEHEKTGKPGRSFQSAAVKMQAAGDGETYGGGFGWDGSAMRTGNSKSPARKAASAQIAKIPAELSAHIARCFKPHRPPALARCDAEIAAMKAELRAGNPNVEGLCLAIHDWSRERRLIEEELQGR